MGMARALPPQRNLMGILTYLLTRPDVRSDLRDDAGHRWDDVRHGFERACLASGLTDFHFRDLFSYLCLLAHYARRTAG